MYPDDDDSHNYEDLGLFLAFMLTLVGVAGLSALVVLIS